MGEEWDATGSLPTVVSSENETLTCVGEAPPRFSFGAPPRRPSQTEEPRQEAKGRGKRLTWICCLLWFCGLLGLTVPMICHAAGIVSGEMSLHAGGEALCRAILSSGLPPVNATPLFGSHGDVETEGADTPTEETGEREEPDTSAATDVSTQEAESLPPQEPPLQSAPIFTADVSFSSAGWDHLLHDSECRIPEIPDSIEWSDRATVLILHSHPYEAFGDGGDTAWHDGEGWAVKLPQDGIYADDGVVALGERMTLLLRLRGVRVIHAVLPAAALTSHMDTYDETKRMLSETLASYPQISLVLDLRRGAEQTEDGCILRTRGSYDGQNVAQLRILTDARRTSGAGERDLRVALDLRAKLFAEEPTLSRPVYLRQGEGLCEGEAAVMLTLEFGTAGNTFEEAERLLVPVADAIADCFGG